MAAAAETGSSADKAGEKQPPPNAAAAGKQQQVITTAHITTKRLLQQLPAGAVLAFQSLASTFTNQGKCYPTNKWLTAGLVAVLSAACIFFSFTDSVFHNGKVYYGVAMRTRLNILNMDRHEEEKVFADTNVQKKLEERRLKPVDGVHAFLSLVVFLTIACGDVGLQDCFFPLATDDTRQWLRNLPLGTAVMTSFLFMIFPTTRKGIRFENISAPAPAPAPAKKQEDCPGGGEKQPATEKAFMYTASVLQQLPTGPVLAFQTLAASFTNQGRCYHANWWLTVGLVTFLGATCVFASFTDCVADNAGKVHKGVVLPGSLCIIDLSDLPYVEQQKQFPTKLDELGLKVLDVVHAFFTAVVFLAIAGSDVGLQNCFFKNASLSTQQLLKNLPLGITVMSSFVFIIFPTTRKVMGFDDSEYSAIDPENPRSSPTANSAEEDVQLTICA